MRTGIFIFVLTQLISCSSVPEKSDQINESSTEYDTVLNREKYFDKLQGFWLGQNIANWTGLVTEMDKIGNIGEIQTGSFYTRDDWGQPDQPSIWGEGVPSDLSANIDFVFRFENEIWGSDDDTDIEYMYQFTIDQENTILLTSEQISNAWKKHIKVEEENYLWVSNQKAFDLMQNGHLPPSTGQPDLNPHFDMIDAQLTTEIFGLYAPLNPDIALKIANLPIRTVASKEAANIAEFYVVMYSLAANLGKENIREGLLKNSRIARNYLKEGTYPLAMYDYVWNLYSQGVPWEATRDSIYQRYQVNEMDGYDITSRNLYCNGCFAAGINYAASLISLFYGEGDFKETVKIGSLTGWDSDNPTATWGGMLGFVYGKHELEEIFESKFSGRYNIHRTRQNFPNDGIDTFENMANVGVSITDRVITEYLGGFVESESNNYQLNKGY